MRKTFLYIALLTGIVVPLRGYVGYHPIDPNAVLLGAFAVTGVEQSHIEIEVWSLSGGVIDYVLDVESIYFDGTCGNVGSLSLEEIVESGTDAAIAEGVSRGYPACSSTAFTKNVRIWSVSCSERSGTGCSTAFEACSTEAWCYRLYQVYCPGDGIPVITHGTGTTCSCSGACEGSCSESNFE